MTFSGLIAVYLFLGGTSAGAYAVLAVLDVASNMSTWNRHDERNRTSHAPKSVVAVKFLQTMWLPVLFVLSALSCGCAVIMLALCSCEDRRAVRQWDVKLLRFDFVFVVLELLVTILLFASLAPVASADVLTGRHSQLFWGGFVLCALLLPIVIEMFSLMSGRHLSAPATAFASVLVLVGGLCLRLVVVAAGVQPLV